ncbi:MAG: di-trans,poly-cis-decaprenylcistransferase [Candidatus Hydrothermota bacterium]|nr:MAG: di-trans,poly-cis-decaprenylcistransferase [Candidatus Hydrothermae bacterium]
MDGNGRWAVQRGLPRYYGHKVGIESVREAVRTALDFGIEYLTLYAFSKENWRRPSEEVQMLMNIFRQVLRREVAELHRQGVKITMMGRIQDLPPDLQQEAFRSMELTKNNQRLKLYLAISYGGRAEIVDAVRKIAKLVKNGELDIEQIDEDSFRNFLYCPELPDPDLLIRTSGEERISNFLLWQIAYTELYITPTLWPDFRRNEFIAALTDYASRERRFGGVK